MLIFESENTNCGRVFVNSVTPLNVIGHSSPAFFCKKMASNNEVTHYKSMLEMNVKPDIEQFLDEMMEIIHNDPSFWEYCCETIRTHIGSIIVRFIPEQRLFRAPGNGSSGDIARHNTRADNQATDFPSNSWNSFSNDSTIRRPLQINQLNEEEEEGEKRENETIAVVPLEKLSKASSSEDEETSLSINLKRKATQSDNSTTQKRQKTVECDRLDPKQLKCPLCDFTSHVDSGMKQHMTCLKHFKCCVCDKKFDDKKKFIENLEIHWGKLPKSQLIEKNLNGLMKLQLTD